MRMYNGIFLTVKHLFLLHSFLSEERVNIVTVGNSLSASMEFSVLKNTADNFLFSNLDIYNPGSVTP